MATRVLFLCTGNSARSQMAEYLLRSIGGEKFKAFSAGTAPAGVNPLTLKALQEMGIDARDATSKRLDVFAGQSFDFVITVCDRARDQCPVFAGGGHRIHWSFEDPAAAEGDNETRMACFRRIATEIADRVRSWVPTAS